MMNNSQNRNNCVAKVYSRGKINLPSDVKHDLAIHDGDQIIFIKTQNSWMITTRNAWIKDAQDYCKTLNPKGESLVDELIKSRRKTAKDEVR